MRGTALILLMLGASLALFQACGGLTREAALARPSGPQFNHVAHLGRGVECSDCHGDEDADYMAMPDFDTCWMCHEDLEEEAPPEKKIAPFFDSEKKPRWTREVRLADEIIYDHGSHVAKVEGDCKVCHEAIADSEAIPADAGLAMADCMACHAERAPEYNDCATCHQRIRQDQAPPSHKLGWRRKHGREARMGAFEALPQNCAMCHSRSDCDTCHRSEKPRSHNNLWRFHGHAAMASMDRESCETCHTTDSCVQCHRMTQPRNHRGSWGSPFNRHCFSCHLPLERGGEEGCAVCHRETPGHDLAPVRPPTLPHQTSDPNACRSCHSPMPHADNGQSCLFCHR